MFIEMLSIKAKSRSSAAFLSRMRKKYPLLSITRRLFKFAQRSADERDIQELQSLYKGMVAVVSALSIDCPVFGKIVEPI